VTIWAATLDAFEQRLDAQERALDGGSHEAIPAFAPAPDLPPIPVDLVDRAVALVWRCRALEDRVTAALNDAKTQLQALADAAPAPAEAAEPVFFDSRV
jgi:hypothetical protein